MNWAGILGSSRAVHMLRAAMTGSVVVNARRQLAVRLPILCRDVQAPPASVDDDRAIVALENSAIVQGAVGLLARIGRSGHDSRSAQVGSMAAGRMLTLAPWQRVRLTALALLSAVMVHLTLTRFSAPEPGWVTRATWIAIATVLIAVMTGARAVAAAWVGWSSHRSSTCQSERA